MKRGSALLNEGRPRTRRQALASLTGLNKTTRAQALSHLTGLNIIQAEAPKNFLVKSTKKMPRVAAEKTATNFFNSKKRVIYVSAKGKYFVMGTKGTQYSPKAAYSRNSNGNPKSLANFSGNVPNAIKPKVGRTRTIGPRRQRRNAGVARGPRPLPPLTANVPLNYGVGMGRMFRAPRKNKGVKRGPRPVSNAAALKALFAEPKGYSRRPRKNKGVARGPRGPRPVSNAAALKALFKEPKGYSRKPRSNKGVARGPRGPRWAPQNVTVLTV